jgi:hypothetical protein
LGNEDAPQSGQSSCVDRVGRLVVGGLRAEVKAECRPDQTSESWQQLVGQLLGFVAVAMRRVESHSGDDEQREDQRHVMAARTQSRRGSGS